MSIESDILYDCLEERYSCRSFTAEKIKTEELRQILNAARLAPTAANNQPERIIVVENNILLEKLNEATRYTFDAKTILVICYDEKESWKRRNDMADYGIVDATLAASNMVLMATTLGIGSCYVASFDEEKVKFILSLPKEYHVALLIPIGYPKEVKAHNTRLDIEDIVEYR